MMPTSTICTSGAPEALPPPVFGAARGVVDGEAELRAEWVAVEPLRVGLAVVEPLEGLGMMVAAPPRPPTPVVAEPLGWAELLPVGVPERVGPVAVGVLLRVGVLRWVGVLLRVGVLRCVGVLRRVGFVVVEPPRCVGLAVVGVAEVGLALVGAGEVADVEGVVGCVAVVMDADGFAFPLLSAVPCAMQ
jgi:hypothetical protein